MKLLIYSGMIAGVGFILGTTILGNILPEYSHISQTVSEIGQHGSPLYYQYQTLDLMVHLLLVVFCIGILQVSRKYSWSALPAWFLMSFGFAGIGIALFASPHPMHNIFGMSMTIGYCSPLVFALTWKQHKWPFRGISMAVFFLIVIGIFLNLSPLFNPSLYPLEYYGLVQRFLLFTFYIYCSYLSLSLLRFTNA